MRKITFNLGLIVVCLAICIEKQILLWCALQSKQPVTPPSVTDTGSANQGKIQRED